MNDIELKEMYSYLAMISDTYFKKNITLADLYDIDGAEYIKIFEYIENNGFSDTYYLDVKMRATYDLLVKHRDCFVVEKNNRWFAFG